MEILWKPLWIGAGIVIIGVILLELIPEHKKTPRKAAVAVISIGVALMLAVACGMLAVMMLPART
ncbi:hypothetical protein MK605_005232 [Escherichia coli]|jgi:uncharacterized protein involved in exopolysaccharide biosynthesis|uniref:hypothetical protein n=1 Tax=Escherichia coli TaxID=562 RepID=UPI0005308DA9|nr:hypothetical protein [Escherichia coli]EBP8466975.1 hypothetical protein [Salmonella enterica]EGD2135798.1 hypothetical protein [Escherichia coli]EGL2280223.1 hypothetical protein [Escherichia coli]EIX7312480.1 hypothetical protein [Escherichia coli]EJO7378214.1 hypothetical protein [Escherichia coli]